MGHEQALSAFVSYLRGETDSEAPRLLGWTEASLATASMFAAQESIRSGQPVDLRRFIAQLLGDESEAEANAGNE